MPRDRAGNMTGMDELRLSEPVTVGVFIDGQEVEVALEPGPLPVDLPEPVRRHLIEAGHATPADPTPTRARKAKED